MKKIYFLLTLIATASFVNAQIKKDAVLLGGQLSYNNASNQYSATQPEQKTSGAYANVNVGKVYKDNHVVGITVGYSRGNSESNYGAGYRTSKSDSYNAGVFYRQYKSLGKDFYFFGALNAGYFGNIINDVYTDYPGKKYKSTENGARLGLTPGLSYAICKKLQLEILLPDLISLRYSDQKNTYPLVSTKARSFYANTSLSGSAVNSLGIGFQLVL